MPLVPKLIVPKKVRNKAFLKVPFGPAEHGCVPEHRHLVCMRAGVAELVDAKDLKSFDL